MKKKILLVSIIIILAGVGYWYFALRKKQESIFLVTEKPQYGYIARTITATGTIEPVDTVNVGAQVSGTIKNIYVDFNSRVTRGQLIAEIDKSLLEAQVNQYKANLEVAKNQLVYQKTVYDRQNLLFQTGAISKQDYDNAVYQYNAAKAAVPSVEAQLAAAEKNLSYCDIYSPINGVVMSKNVSIGQTVASSFNTPTLFIIAKDIAKMQVQAAVDEADIGSVTLGQRATFTVDAFPDAEFSGIVGQIRLQPIVSANVVTYTTIIKTENVNMQLKPGMTANIFIYTKEDSDALLIPATALKFMPDQALGKQYFIQPLADEDSKANRPGKKNLASNTGYKSSSKNKSDESGVPGAVWVKVDSLLIQKSIHTGMTDDTRVQVLDGLTVNDEVVISEKTSAAKSATAKVERSPFMPARRSSTPAKAANKPNR